MDKPNQLYWTMEKIATVDDYLLLTNWCYDPRGYQFIVLKRNNTKNYAHPESVEYVYTSTPYDTENLALRAAELWLSDEIARMSKNTGG